MEEWFNNFGDKLKRLPGEILGLPDPEDEYNRKRNAAARMHYAMEWDKAIKKGFTEEELIKSGFKKPEIYYDVQASGLGGGGPGGGGFPIPIIPTPTIHTSATTIQETKEFEQQIADLKDQEDSKADEDRITRTPNEISILLPSSDEVKVPDKLNIKRKNAL